MRNQCVTDAARRQQPRRLRALMVRSLQRMDLEFLAHRRVYVEGKIAAHRYGDQHESSAQPRNADAHIHRLQGASGIQHQVHPAAARFIHHRLLHPVHRHYNIGAHLARQFQPVRKFVADIHPCGPRLLRHRGAQHPDRSRAHHRYRVPKMHRHKFHHVHNHRHRFNQSSLCPVQTLRHRIGVVLGRHRVFTKQSRSLRAAQKHAVDTVVVLPAKAELAVAARQRRLDRHPVAHLSVVDPFADGDNLTRRFVPQYLWVSRGRMPDPAFEIPVHVRSADPDRLQLHQHFPGTGVGRVRESVFFQGTLGYQSYRSHE